GLEGAREGGPGDAAPGGVGDVDGEDEAAAGAEQPADLGEDAGVRVASPFAAGLVVALGVLEGEAGDDAVEAAGLPVRESRREVGGEKADDVRRRSPGRDGGPDLGERLLVDRGDVDADELGERGLRLPPEHAGELAAAATEVEPALAG